jgi:hypothetical protein
MENEFYRFEFKYNLEPGLARLIESELKNYGMRLDKHVCKKKQNYTVTSLYFDSCHLSDYYDKIDGLLKRKKLRARIYEPCLKESNTVWLEVKEKYDMKIHKKRFGLTRDEWETFLKKGPSSLLKINEKSGAKGTKNDVLWHFLSNPVKPFVFIRYIRRPYILDDDFRITFDSKIEACKNNCLDYNKFMSPVKNNGVIMEVKFSHLLPFWFKNIIRKYNIRRGAFSKYSNSVDAVYLHNPLSK